MTEQSPDRTQADLDQDETRTLLNTLITESRAVTSVNRELAVAMVVHQERARLAKRRYLVTLMLIVLGFSGLYVRQQVSNANIVAGRNASRHVLNQIADCIDPGGACAKRSARNTAAFIAQLTGANSRIVSLAAACAPDYVSLPLAERIVAIEKCIAGGLDK